MKTIDALRKPIHCCTAAPFARMYTLHTQTDTCYRCDRDMFVASAPTCRHWWELLPSLCLGELVQKTAGEDLGQSCVRGMSTHL